jgi:hypothetical protein
MTNILDDLFEAVRSRNHERVRELLQRSPQSAVTRDGQGVTALHYAAESGDREIVTMLLDASADVNARDPAIQRDAGRVGDRVSPGTSWVRRYVERFPVLCDAVDRNGIALKEHARNCGNREIARLLSA